MKSAQYLEERQQNILALIRRSGRATVSELSRAFGVSEVTIRADLQSLAQRQLIVRTHGGALAMGYTPELSLALRREQQPAAKARIGAAAAALVNDGEAIFLDASSTVLAIAAHLKEHHELTVITNSLAVAQLLLDAPGITVVMPGGFMQRETASLIGLEGLELLNKFNIQKGFFGAQGLSLPEGLSDASIADAEIKRQMVKLCRQVIVVLDSTKWQRVGLASYARLTDIHCVITDKQAPATLVRRVRAAGVKVILA